LKGSEILPPNLAVDIAGISLKSPVLTASGTFGFGEEYRPLTGLEGIGALVVKGITCRPRPGNLPPRLFETPAGLLNSIGLQNPGVEAFISCCLPALRRHGLPVIVNIAGETVEEYAHLARRLDGAAGIAGLEVNVSCPNVKKGGMQFGSDPYLAAQVTRAVKESTSLPVIVKLSPNVTSIAAVAESVAKAGADALSLINTLLGMAIDIKTRRPVLGHILGGLSGPAVKPVALGAVWQVYRAVDLPIIGMGGITTGEDAVEFFLAGASAVAVGTAHFVNPYAARDVAEGIKNYLLAYGFKDIKEIVGAAHL